MASKIQAKEQRLVRHHRCLLCRFRLYTYLVSQNKERDQKVVAGTDGKDKYDEVYIAVMEAGNAVKKTVDRVRFISIPLSSHRTLFILGGLMAFPDRFFRLPKISRTFRTESSVMPFRMPRGTGFLPIQMVTAFVYDVALADVCRRGECVEFGKVRENTFIAVRVRNAVWSIATPLLTR